MLSFLSIALDDGSDADLVSSMAGRLAMAERELLAAKREIIEKDEKIASLEEKVTILSMNGRNEREDESVVMELKQRCLEYQKQIADMEVRERGTAHCVLDSFTGAVLGLLVSIAQCTQSRVD